MDELKSNSAGTVEWDALRRITLNSNAESTSVTFRHVALAVPITDHGLERRGWAYEALEGIERWEAQHGLGQDDV